MNAYPLAIYVVAAIAYVVHFAKRHEAAGRVATVTLVFGALVHAFVIGMQTMQVGHIPFAGTTGAVSAFVCLLALAYLYTEMMSEERAMGVFIAPLMALLQVIPATTNSVFARAAVLDSPWFAIHVSALLFAYASFALASVVGLTYVLLFKELKAKDLGFFYARLPSLRVLDLMNGRAVTVGWVFLTVGLVVGAIWLLQVQPGSADPRVQAMTLLDPKIFIVLMCWVVYSFAIYARQVSGWSGRRAAMLSAVGFMILLLNFVPVGYFISDSHNFY